MEPIEIEREIERARPTFHDLVERASAEDLHRRSHGTRWTNRQLLWHMVFGYLIVRTCNLWSARSGGSAGAAASPPH